MDKVMKSALPRIVSILLFQLAFVVFCVGVYDFMRGQTVLPVQVPKCTTDCVDLPTGTSRAVLDASLGDRTGVEALFGEENLCALPEALFSTARFNETTQTVIQAFEVDGLANISQEGEDIVVSHGRNTRGALSALRKLVNPELVNRSCYEPWWDWYGPATLLLLSLGLLFALGSKAKRGP